MNTARIGISLALTPDTTDCVALLRVRAAGYATTALIQMEALGRWVQTDNKDGLYCFS